MNKTSVQRLLLALAVIALTGCETIAEKRKIDYKTSRSTPPLAMPSDLVAPPTDNLATTPGAAGVTTYSEFTSGSPKARATPSKVLPAFSGMRIERDGQLRWLVVKGDADALWPRMREFVLTQGLLVARENPASGLIETEWAENRAKVGSTGQRVLAKWLGTLYSTGTRDRFRFRLDRGANAGVSEIYVSQQGMEEIISTNSATGQSEGTRWQPRAAEPDIEMEMLRLLMVYLGTPEPEADAAVQTAEAAKSTERARLVKAADGKGPSSLSLQENLDRAWRRVGLMLDRVGFTVDDRDRSQGLYFIRYVDPEKKSKSAKEDEYRILIKAAEAGSVVEVLDKDGKPAADKSGDRILGLLHNQLK